MDNPQVEQALEEHCGWIDQVTDLAREENLQALWQSIIANDEEHLRTIIFVLILGRAQDKDRLTEFLAKLN